MSIERVEAQLAQLAHTVVEFKVETARTLGRIETLGVLNKNGLDALEDRVTEVEVDTKVAAKVAGRRGGAFGAALGVVVGGIFEGLRQWFQ